MFCLRASDTTYSTDLGPVQTAYLSCAEPNTIWFDAGSSLVRLLTQTAYLIVPHQKLVFY